MTKFDPEVVKAFIADYKSGKLEVRLGVNEVFVCSYVSSVSRHIYSCPSFLSCSFALVCTLVPFCRSTSNRSPCPPAMMSLSRLLSARTSSKLLKIPPKMVCSYICICMYVMYVMYVLMCVHSCLLDRKNTIFVHVLFFYMAYDNRLSRQRGDHRI